MKEKRAWLSPQAFKQGLDELDFEYDGSEDKTEFFKVIYSANFSLGPAII